MTQKKPDPKRQPQGQTDRFFDKRSSIQQTSIGIDFGGTKVAAALMTSEGEVLQHVRAATLPPWLKSADPKILQKSPTPHQVKQHIDYVVNAMADTAMEVASPLLTDQKKMRHFRGIGLASAGPMNVDEGVLQYPCNLRGWKVVPLVSLLKQELIRRGLRTDIYFQNDAIAAAVGEGWIGQAAGCKTFVMITVGTGIGTGVILNGKPAQSGGMGSEWGQLLSHSAGISSARETYNDRSVEGMASGTGLLRRAKSRGFKGLSTEELVGSARNGNKLALKCFSEASEALAVLFYSLSLGFHPEKFVVSGGMIAVREFFLPEAIEIYKELIKAKNPTFYCPVQVAKLGVRAGVIGAARLPYL